MTRRHSRAAAALGLAAILAAIPLLESCSSRLGWGLVLWTAPDGPLPAGSIVPVYIKSNIQKVYVVGVPGAKGKKIELPLWQIELFPTRGKAAARVKSMGSYISLYMVAARDGLPLRDRPSNEGKRVYRLREGQSVKVLDRAAGEAVSTGGAVLPGSWYQVLTDDGTEGYVFSYAFRLYDEAKEGPPMIASAKEALTGRVDLIFSRSWRPEYFQEMLDDGRIDLDYFSLRFGVFVDGIRRQVRIELPAASQVFDYTGISETEGLYAFEGTPLRIRIESDNRMVCSWTGDDALAKGGAATGVAPSAQPAATPGDAAAEEAPVPPESAVEGYESAGSSGSAVFVVLTADPLESIRLEALRRQKLLGAFVDEIGGSWIAPGRVPSGAAPGSAGPGPGSGRLAINKNGRFSWKDRGDAAAALRLPADAGESGDIAIRLFLDPSLSSSWSGALSLRFDQSESGASRPKWLNFLYRRSPAGLVLAPASAAPGSLVVQAADPGAEPLVLEAATD
jgi:hypothetical protein